MIIGVDINPKRKALAEKFGMTHFINPKEIGGDLVAHIVELTKGGADYSFECIGNVDLMRQALECCHRGWGHRRRRRRQGNFDAAVSTRHRPRLEGIGLRRRARPHPTPADRRLVHERQDQHRRPDHSHDAAGKNQ
jgi:hypothetical protein